MRGLNLGTLEQPQQANPQDSAPLKRLQQYAAGRSRLAPARLEAALNVHPVVELVATRILSLPVLTVGLETGVSFSHLTQLLVQALGLREASQLT
jgi:hypothetical protein